MTQYIELDGREARLQWRHKKKGDQVRSVDDPTRWINVVWLDAPFQDYLRYRRPVDQPTEAMHFL